MALAVLSLPLCACSSGLSLRKAEIDPTLLTSGVDAGSGVYSDIGDYSDEATIRNFVSTADIESAAGKALAWVNPATGTRGTVTAIDEQQEEGKLCRRFVTSRERFDGVALFRGKACMLGAGIWRMISFAPA